MSEHIDEIEDGGPAFPKPGTDECIDVCGSQRGMSLRDWFAGQAMAAMIARDNHDDVFGDVLDSEPVNPNGEPLNDYGDKSSFDVFLRWGPCSAYTIADAMLTARKQVRG